MEVKRKYYINFEFFCFLCYYQNRNSKPRRLESRQQPCAKSLRGFFISQIESFNGVIRESITP